MLRSIAHFAGWLVILVPLGAAGLFFGYFILIGNGSGWEGEGGAAAWFALLVFGIPLAGIVFVALLIGAVVLHFTRRRAPAVATPPQRPMD